MKIQNILKYNSRNLDNPLSGYAKIIFIKPKHDDFFTNLVDP